MMTTIILMLILFTECFGCLANETNELSVRQTPSEIRVSTGMPAEINCSWKNNDSVKRFRVTWKIQNLTCKEGTSKDLFSKLYYTVNYTHKDQTVLRIDVVKGNDTGIYFCEITIEIPFMKKGMGNGTTLIVEEKVSERRTHEEQTLQVMELDEGNEINEADERNSSSNSSEWVTSTLYESLDYFAMKQNEDKEEDNKHSVAFSSNAAD
ncbi:uncharacterized protein LOC102462366 isoform X2 [Pelodiscus sinensis]|uniref:uncharacterized protein LOC102462366 isoform X2 n=1 Tax=Pelodiscus sinensis TaxID=13735 RepID=UPI000703D8C9|nr:uncharacterized protein LOC102462366 isoform X3 [Pelodiscus sinensis]|eukprot:XP_014431549.1 uncharacterized protein LOC102462366 isoform X3 [Pelodiscus sinensis]